jgi:hypothetical protein
MLFDWQPTLESYRVVIWIGIWYETIIDLTHTHTLTLTHKERENLLGMVVANELDCHQSVFDL